MKTLIAYATKTGTTRACARILGELLPGATLWDLSQKRPPNPSDFEVVIVGGSIRMGTLHPSAQTFLRKYRKQLLTRDTGYFICCCADGKTQEYFRENLPADLLEHARCLENFGGELDLDKQKGFDRMVASMMLEAQARGGPEAQAMGEMTQGLHQERIIAFARAMGGTGI